LLGDGYKDGEQGRGTESIKWLVPTENTGKPRVGFQLCEFESLHPPGAKVATMSAMAARYDSHKPVLIHRLDREDLDGASEAARPAGTGDDDLTERVSIVMARTGTEWNYVGLKSTIYAFCRSIVSYFCKALQLTQSLVRVLFSAQGEAQHLPA
jgi:hypothetical protein